MKKNYLKFILAITLSVFISHSLLALDKNAKDPKKEYADLQRNSELVNPPSLLAIGSDVVMKPATENQTDVKIAVAFNGWNYSICTTHGGANDGIYVMISKDHGVTWNVLTSAPGYYYSSDLAVCGNDTNALDLYISSILYDAGTGMHTFWVNKANARTGANIGVLIAEASLDTVYDVALAHDYLHPATGASPYSVEAIYSKRGASEDSVIAYQSIDGGATFADRKVVDTNSDRFGKVALSYGYSPAFSSGQYFVAWEQHLLGQKYGNLKVSRTDAVIGDPFTTPMYADSVFTVSEQNHARNPSFSVQNSASNNDSTGLTAVLLWESSYNGGFDIDNLGVFSFQAGSPSGTWRTCLVDYSTTHTYQADICYNDVDDKFLVTYWDSTNNRLRYYTQGFNLLTPNTWTQGFDRYNDRVGSLINSYPQIAFDPSAIVADFVWSETRSSWSTALFDAENSSVGVPEHHMEHLNFSQNYPNPASDFTIFNFELDKSQQVLLEVYDLVGNKVRVVVNENMTAGTHELKMDVSQLAAGSYTYKIKSGNSEYSNKLTVIR